MRRVRTPDFTVKHPWLHEQSQKLYILAKYMCKTKLSWEYVEVEAQILKTFPLILLSNQIMFLKWPYQVRHSPCYH